jgi:transcriptional regulator with XRE-family HTH domain
MPAHDDNPLRLARLRAGVPLSRLAAAVGANRSTLVAIEEGRTKSPARPLLWQLDNQLGLATGTLEGQLQGWHRDRSPLERLNARQRAVLADTPANVSQYRSFVHWRREFAASPTAFASLIGVDRAKVADYENGVRVNGMPDTLATALVNKLGITNAYLVELQRLEPNDE